MARKRDLADQRERLSEATWSVLTERGLAGLTIRAVAERAGCTTGLVMHAFPSKEALLLHARELLHERTRIRADAVEEETGREPAAALLAVLLNGAALDDTGVDEARVWVSYLAASLADDGLAERHVAGNRSFIGRVGRWVALSRPDRSAEENSTDALALVALVEGLNALSSADAESYSPEVQRRVLGDAVARLVAGAAAGADGGGGAYAGAGTGGGGAADAGAGGGAPAVDAAAGGSGAAIMGDEDADGGGTAGEGTAGAESATGDDASGSVRADGARLRAALAGAAVVGAGVVTGAVGVSGASAGLGEGRRVRVRPYEEGDDEGIVALWAECGLTRPWNDPRRDIARKKTVQPELFLVGEAVDGDGRALRDGSGGTVVVATAMIGYDGHRGWVNYLAVAPGMQGHGVGGALMRQAEELLRERGCPKVNLQIRAGNEGVMAFYRSLGYEPDGAVGFGKRLIADG